jgi:hypothetical protein
MANGAVSDVNMSTRHDVVRCGIEGSRCKLTVDTGVEGNVDDGLFVKEGLIRRGHRWVTIPDVGKCSRRHEGEAAKKPAMALMATTRFLLLSSIETPHVILQGCLTPPVLVF